MDDLIRSEQRIKEKNSGLLLKCFLCEKLDELRGKTVFFSTKTQFSHHLHNWHQDYLTSFDSYAQPTISVNLIDQEPSTSGNVNLIYQEPSTSRNLINEDIEMIDSPFNVENEDITASSINLNKYTVRTN
ncbi:hypothetical protein BLA29_000244 [Euroglyphus maynei]|uniref:Uncharacterized protein n=1 Tax=Euroglyphus maynei TaxID=6958 RepID=A0A1Y3AV40_EURMA|nr:hypothetical protein BLA29_000244 [Euroglyphus maynei]